jgi:ethanolamine utilization protein EutP (predicted NTPase)
MCNNNNDGNHCVCWCTTITMMETHNGFHQCYCTSADTMVSIIVIVVHQQTQWFPSLLLLYINRHNIDGNHCLLMYNNNNDGNHCVCWCTTITMMETIVSVDVQQCYCCTSADNGFHHCYCCTSADTMVSIIVIVVHQQTQWFPSMLLYISRHNGFHHWSADVQQ